MNFQRTVKLETPMHKKVRNLQEFLKSYSGKIGLVSHINPDGDAVGSLLGLYLFLKKAGKRVTPYLAEKVPHYLDFLPDVDKIQSKLDATDIDLIILIDATEFSRTGFNAPQTTPIIRIDHHISGRTYSKYDVVIPGAPSTASILLKFARKYDETLISTDIKKCLYTGLLTDTVSFRHSNSFPWAFKDAYYLVSTNLDVTDIASLVYERKKIKTLQLLARVLSTIFIRDQVAIITIGKELLLEYNIDRSETEGFVSYPLSVDEAIVGVSIVEIEEDRWRTSLRGKNKVNLAKVAETFGDGGHFNAAGCTINGKLDEVIDSLIRTIKIHKV